jgi:peroxiredoxin
MLRPLVLLLFFCLLQLSAVYGDEAPQDAPKWGHSHLGGAYDEGPRTRPWKMEGIGETHFPISTSHPEVQKWFDQGNTLLHGFWYFEAERSFRWCLKLDPSCAMAYWGLARCALYDEQRAKDFLKQASKLKDSVTDRERDCIELWELKHAIDRGAENVEQQVRRFTEAFDRLLIKYPDDIEALCLYWVELPKAIDPEATLQDIPYRFAMEKVLQDALRIDPNHVGALHYRLHNWDSSEGQLVLDSCRRLREVAPMSGHLHHMPAHIFAELGRWHEAAIAMDAATRIEKDYMRRRMILPEQNWNYSHNLMYLGYIQEQLGMQEAAIQGARQLLSGPADNTEGDFVSFQKIPMIRLLIKYERWDEILDSGNSLLIWDETNPIDQFFNNYMRSYALLGTGDIDGAAEEIEKARRVFDGMKNNQITADAAKSDDQDSTPTLTGDRLDKVFGWKVLELESQLEFARRNTRSAIEKMQRAARMQADNWANDPPIDPGYLYNALGEMYLKSDQPRLAADAFETTLRRVANDGFALSGLVRAYSALHETEKSRQALTTLLSVWSDADRPNRWLTEASTIYPDVSPKNDPQLQLRSYKREILEKLGPSFWRPPSAPEFSALDSHGLEKTLKDFSGRNVIVIFYLGGQCLHCMEQIGEANTRWEEFQSQDTDIVTISKDDAETNRGYEQSGFKITLLSDPDFANAKRFDSFDEFEGIELHSTMLIDKKGRIHWSRRGGEPFMDFDFLDREVKRLNQVSQKDLQP